MRGHLVCGDYLPILGKRESSWSYSARRCVDTSLLHTFADIGITVGQFVERKQMADETAALVRELQATTSGTPTIRGLLSMHFTISSITTFRKRRREARSR